MDTVFFPDNSMILLLSTDDAIYRQLQEILADTGIHLQCGILGQPLPPDIITISPVLVLLDCRRHVPQLSFIMAQFDCPEQPAPISMLAICRATDTGMIASSFHAGFQDVLTTPFQSEEVCARIQAHLRFRQQQQELLEQQDRFQKLAEASSEGILIHDEGIILEMNQALLDMIGYEYDELLGRDATEFLTPESSLTAREHFAQNYEQSYALFATRRDGSEIPVSIQGRHMQWKGRTIQVVTIRDLSMQSFLHQEQQTLSATLGEKDHFGPLVGRSRAMRNVYEKILRSALTDAPVMIYGETGTGKELTARMIFTNSDHHKARFLPVNCASIPDHLFESQFFGHRKGSFTGADFNHPGYFEQAKGGTLFLDEIGELPLPMQAKLLRVLEDRSYSPVGSVETVLADVRIITATNRNLRELEQQGRFRSDFFYRLHVLSIDLPPLRARKEDIPLLINHYFKMQAEAGKQLTMREVPPTLLEQFQAYDWPGNVRELYNEIERYLVEGEVRLERNHPSPPPGTEKLDFLLDNMPLAEAVDRFEHYYISKVLQQHRGLKTKAADALRVDRKTLYSKLRKHAKRLD